MLTGYHSFNTDIGISCGIPLMIRTPIGRKSVSLLDGCSFYKFNNRHDGKGNYHLRAHLLVHTVVFGFILRQTRVLDKLFLHKGQIVLFYKVFLNTCSVYTYHFSFDPDGDPLCMLLLLDFYALRASEFDFLIRMGHEWEVRNSTTKNCF